MMKKYRFIPWLLGLLILTAPVVSNSYNIKKFWLSPGPILYDFRDEFSDTLSAGSVNGTLSTSGHLRTVVDTENKLSITGGNLSFAGGKASPASGDPGIWWPAQTRVAGKILVTEITRTNTTGGGRFGFDIDTSGSVGSDAFSIESSNGGIGSSGSIATTVIGPHTSGQSNTYFTIMRSSGSFDLAKGYDYSTTKLLFFHSTGNTSPVYPSFANYSSASTSSFIRVPSQRWLPTPLVSHGFTSAITPSDGTGHTETSGLGSGGGGVVMTGATWSISGGKAVNTPSIIDNEQVTNGDFSSSSGWSGAGWSIGSGIATATSTSNYLTRAISLSGGWFILSADVLTRTDGTVYPRVSNIYYARTAPGTYTFIFRGVVSDYCGFDAASFSGTVDNISVKPLTLSELFLTAPLSTSNVVASADLTITAGTQAGLGLRLDSASNPTKGLVAYNNGTNCKLDQFTTATTWTNLISAACTYSAGAKLVAITDGTSGRLYYNNTLIGTTASIDASITGTYHGLFSTSSSNSIDNLVIYARGTEGQYDGVLNRFIQPYTGVSGPYILDESGGVILDESGAGILME